MSAPPPGKRSRGAAARAPSRAVAPSLRIRARGCRALSLSRPRLTASDRVASRSLRAARFGRSYFHADPHPGNLLVTPEGRLALIDFGLMADVPIQDTKTMTKTIVHLMQGDVPGLSLIHI